MAVNGKFAFTLSVGEVAKLAISSALGVKVRARLAVGTWVLVDGIIVLVVRGDGIGDIALLEAGSVEVAATVVVEGATVVGKEVEVAFKARSVADFKLSVVVTAVETCVWTLTRLADAGVFNSTQAPKQPPMPIYNKPRLITRFVFRILSS